MNSAELVRVLSRQALSSSAGTFFLNGAPGIGKSHLLSELASKLQEEIPYSFSLDPYLLNLNAADDLGRRMIASCHQACFIDSDLDGTAPLSITDAWRWLAQNMHISSRQTFWILIDIQEEQDLAKLGTVFSDARRLEGEWDHETIGLQFLFAGHWDHPVLRKHYTRIETSFPYTPEKNYMVWSGLSVEQISHLLMGKYPEAEPLLHGRLLHELTNGHAGAALDILEHAPDSQLSLSALLKGCQAAAAESSSAGKFVRCWQNLPEEALVLVHSLLLRQHVTVSSNPHYLEQLEAAGIVCLERLGASNYVSFNSWYVELVARLHADALGISDDRTSQIAISQIVPSIVELNVEAYRLINSIENHVRNFVASQLLGDGEEKSILHHPTVTTSLENGYESATKWRERHRRKNLPVDLNPLHCYLGTRKLSGLIYGIAAELDSNAWRRIAAAVDDMAHIRDAVMHNQLISDDELNYLYALQADIYKALSET